MNGVGADATLFGGRCYNLPMLRGLFNFCAAMSMLVLLASPLLWWHSRSYRDKGAFNTGHGDYGILSAGGRCGYHYQDYGENVRGWRLEAKALPEGHSFNRWSYLAIECSSREYQLDFAGIHYFHLRDEGEGHLTQLLIPYTYWAVLAAVLPGIWVAGAFKRRSERQRQERNLCRGCGYDLRAHRPGQKCPECGSVIANASAPTA